MKKSSLPVVLLVALLFSASAYAHAHLHSSDPKADGTVSMMPSEINLEFSEKIEVRLSSVQVQDSSGHDFFEKLSTNEKNPREVHVALQPGGKAGKYQVSWKAVSGDSHKSNGQFNFIFQPK